jgi:RNA polymerase sigma-70 factor, ECF subfamily
LYSQSDPANPKSTNHLAESQLVDLLISGDVIAWRSFLEDYGRLIRWRISDVARSFGLASDTNSIDDATAHTIASLVANDHAALRTFQGRSSLGTYLTVIATRVATRDFARLRARMKKVHAASGTDGEKSSLQDPALELVRSEEHQQLQSALNRLPEKQREVVRMFHLEGCSYMDISRTLQIPLGSVGVTLKRAEEKLRQILEPSQE